MISEGIKNKLIMAMWLPNSFGHYESMHRRINGTMVSISGCELTIHTDKGSKTQLVETINDICEVLKENGLHDTNLERYCR